MELPGPILRSQTAVFGARLPPLPSRGILQGLLYTWSQIATVLDYARFLIGEEERGWVPS
jgi:hypothetical protein